MNRDRKYGVVTTEFGNFYDDEPVVVLRGRDRLVPELLRMYAELCSSAGSPLFHVDLVQHTANTIAAWQEANSDLVRTPNSAAYRERVSE